MKHPSVDPLLKAPLPQLTSSGVTRKDPKDRRTKAPSQACQLSDPVSKLTASLRALSSMEKTSQQ